MKRSLAVHFQSYPLALAEKEQLATAVPSLIAMTPTNQQCPFQSHEMLNDTAKTELVQQNVQFMNTNCIQSDGSILGLSVQGLVSHVIMFDIQQAG